MKFRRAMKFWWVPLLSLSWALPAGAERIKDMAQTARGDRLPAVVREGPNYSLTIDAGSITLNGDLTFSDSYSFTLAS